MMLLTTYATLVAGRSRRRQLPPRCAPLMLALALLTLPSSVSGQETIPDQVTAGPIAESVISDEASELVTPDESTEFTIPDASAEFVAPGHAGELQYSLGSGSYCDGCDHPLDACACGGIDWPRFEMYLKAGPSFQLGKGLFEESTKVGYEITFGGRELLLPYNRQVFFDFGGSYLSAFGRGQPHTISGVIDRSGLGAPLRLDEFRTLTLEDLSRASVHAALGWYYDFSETPEISQLVTMRFGGRLSHIHGNFREDPTDALQAAIDTSNLLGQSFTLANDQLISKTDTAPGIFAGIELENTRHVGPGATLSFLIDAEFSSDWIDLKNYVDGSLVTANILFGLSLNR